MFICKNNKCLLWGFLVDANSWQADEYGSPKHTYVEVHSTLLEVTEPKSSRMKNRG